MLRDTHELGSSLDFARARTRALGLIAGLASLAVVAACTASHKLISARHTACPVRKVEIRNLVTQPQREDWIAVCGEHSYACSTRERGQRLVYGCRALVKAQGSAREQHPDAGAPDGGAAPNPSTPHTASAHGSPEGGPPP